MGLFSIFSKNKQESTAQDSGHFSRDDDNLAERARAKRAAYAGEAAASSRRSRSGGDPMLPEKKRARRRLVGAIALALAAAVGLPMLLDSEPRPLVGDIAIDIPAKDKAPALPVPSSPVPAADSVDQDEEIIDPPAPPASTQGATQGATQGTTQMPPPVKTAQAPKFDPKELVYAEPERKPEPKHEPKPEPKKAEPKPVEHKPEPKKPEPKPEPKVAEKPVPKKAEEKPRARDEEAARALALLEGKPAAKAEKPAADKPEAAQRFVVQVAALASQEKVAELQAKLRAAGVSAHTRKSGELIRVQVGPFGSREEAEKARARLSSQGFSGFLVPV